MKYILIEVFNTGGEYTSGIISDKTDIENMNQVIKDEELSTWISYKNDNDKEINLAASDFSEKVQCYGPNVTDSKISTYTCDEDGAYDFEKDTIIDNIPIDNTDINIFCLTNPYYSNEELKALPEGSLIWSSEKIEKRIKFPAVIKLDDNEKFELKNVFIGTYNLDETINDSEIVSDILYINDKEKLIIYSKFPEYKDYNLEDFNGLLYEEYEGSRDLFSNYLAEIGDIEGKGESENDYNLIQSMDLEKIIEIGIY